MRSAYPSCNGIVWSNAKVRDLFDSMYKGFPVGYLLFWANGADDGHRQIGTDAKQKIPRLLIVDGQQRLTALFAVLIGIPVVRQRYNTERISSPFVEQFRTFCHTVPAMKHSVFTLGNSLEDLLSGLWGGV